MPGILFVLKGANRTQVVWEGFVQEAVFELKTEYEVAVRRVYWAMQAEGGGEQVHGHAWWGPSGDAVIRKAEGVIRPGSDWGWSQEGDGGHMESFRSYTSSLLCLELRPTIFRPVSAH